MAASVAFLAGGCWCRVAVVELSLAFASLSPPSKFLAALEGVVFLTGSISFIEVGTAIPCFLSALAVAFFGAVLF